jgi:type IV pilus assembly protein PilB
MAAARVLLGELLVEAQIITREQLEEVLELQKKDGRRIGTLLVEAGVVTETQVTQILSQQLSVPWVSLYHIDFSRQLLNLVPRELAERHCLVPIFVRRVRGHGETLYIAMDNPENESAKQEVAQYAGLPVRAMIAPPGDIRGAIRAYYAGAPPEEGKAEAPPTERISRPPGDAMPPRSDTPPPPNAPAAAAITRPRPSEPPRSPSQPMAAVARVPSAHPKADTLPPDSSPQISARDVSLPPPRKGGERRMLTLTLLDGTQINLPAKSGAKGEEARLSEDDLTARDLVAALRAVSHGADASEVLGENVRWEKLIAALLNVLLRKHLIADWEFVDEYRKI